MVASSAVKQINIPSIVQRSINNRESSQVAGMEVESEYGSCTTSMEASTRVPSVVYVSPVLVAQLFSLFVGGVSVGASTSIGR